MCCRRRWSCEVEKVLALTHFVGVPPRLPRACQKPRAGPPGVPPLCGVGVAGVVEASNPNFFALAASCLFASISIFLSNNKNNSFASCSSSALQQPRTRNRLVRSFTMSFQEAYWAAPPVSRYAPNAHVRITTICRL